MELERCQICQEINPYIWWDPTAGREFCMYPGDCVSQPHWWKICPECRDILTQLPDQAYAQALLLMARKYIIPNRRAQMTKAKVPGP